MTMIKYLIERLRDAARAFEKLGEFALRYSAVLSGLALAAFLLVVLWQLAPLFTIAVVLLWITLYLTETT